jgi:hypothetical protein
VFCYLWEVCSADVFLLFSSDKDEDDLETEASILGL